jgi:hypothetical protein
MARNGSGVYSLPAGNPVVTGTTISSTWANTTLTDISTALTGSLASDGQTSPTANLTMAGLVHTNVGNATVRTNYASAADVQDSKYQYLTVTGTDTIVASNPIGFTAYVAGQVFRFIPAGANTGAVTININSVGAKAITKNGTSPLVAGDIPANTIVTVVYDGTQFQLSGSASLLSSDNTWTGINAFNGPLAIPVGNVAQRPDGLSGYIRYNSQYGYYEGSQSTAGAAVNTITRGGAGNLTATVTTLTPHNLATGDYVFFSGVTPSQFNGGYNITVTGTTTFTYTMASAPSGNATVVGSYVWAKWVSFTAAVGNGGDQVFIQNNKNVTYNYTIPTGTNAMSTGDITVNSGITVTIPSGSRWVII